MDPENRFNILSFKFFNSLLYKDCEIDHLVAVLKKLYSRNARYSILNRHRELMDIELVRTFCVDYMLNWYMLALLLGRNISPETILHQFPDYIDQQDMAQVLEDMYNTYRPLDVREIKVSDIDKEGIMNKISACINPTMATSDLYRELRKLSREQMHRLVRRLVLKIFLYAKSDQERYRLEQGIGMLYKAGADYNSFFLDPNTIRQGIHEEKYDYYISVVEPEIRSILDGIDNRRRDVVSSLTLGSGGLPIELSHKIASMEFRRSRKKSR